MPQHKQELMAADEPQEEMTGLMAIQAAEINQQIATAKKYARPKVGLILNEVHEMTGKDEETAASMFYSIPRDGKQIEGPSVRLAEIFATQWGNMRAGSRVVSIGDDLVTAQGFAIDLQTNFAYSTEVQRSIKGRRGRFSADMIRVTCLAAQAIAFREAVFHVVPRVYIDEVYDRCKRVAIGAAQSIVQRREKVATSFSKMGISRERIALALGLNEFKDIQDEHIGTLRGLYTAITDGDTTLDEAFPPMAEPAQVAAGVPPKQVTGVQGSELIGGGPPPVAKPKRTTQRKPPQAPPGSPEVPPEASGPPVSQETPEIVEDAPAEGQGPQEVAPDGPAVPEPEPAPGTEAASAPIQMKPPVDMFAGNGNTLMPQVDAEAEVSDPEAEARREEWSDYILAQNTIKPMKPGGDIRNRVDVDTSMGPMEREYLNGLMDRRVAELRAKRQ